MTTKTNKICHSLKNHHIKRQIKYHQIKYTTRMIFDKKCLFVKKPFFFRFPSKNAIFRQIQKSMVNIKKIFIPIGATNCIEFDLKKN